MAEADREKWDAKYRTGDYGPGDPAWLDPFAEELPTEGKALDIAAGAGRTSVWLARRGFDVLSVDISPVGLALAREMAADEGVKIETRAMDLEREPFPEGPFDLIVCFHYRQPTLFPLIATQVAPGGIVVAELATMKNLERQKKPSRKWLCESNELLSASRDLQVVYYRESWVGDRHLSRLIARRPE